MIRSTAFGFKRLIAAFCVVIMLLHAATVPVRAKSDMNHLPFLTIAHDHVSDVSFDVVSDGHAALQDAVPADLDDEPDNHLAGGHHHHHSDIGSYLVPDEVGALNLTEAPNTHRAMADRQIEPIWSALPERPPRASLLIA